MAVKKRATMYLKQFSLSTDRENFYEITHYVRDAVKESGMIEGLCTVYCPHTTAGITINENADPDVAADMLCGLRKAFPDRAEFHHAEGNSSAHLKASCTGSSASVIISGGRLLLGTWQGIYFCEFDGPRTRKYFVHIA
ncbi:MAG: secondary thiamine-phosphate synthase enzyme YjbQ [Treponemataceae bacterium]|nr:MAG: secondary thiamine-phosphate synthase enzyme YjbQ [Treponemataceae bacterium]